MKLVLKASRGPNHRSIEWSLSKVNLRGPLVVHVTITIFICAYLNFLGIVVDKMATRHTEGLVTVISRPLIFGSAVWSARSTYALITTVVCLMSITRQAISCAWQ